MRANQSSATAENNAAIRLFESLRPQAERVCHDPYAICFVSDDLRQSPDLTTALLERLTVWEKWFPGVCDAIVARTRFIDDSLQAAIDKGLQQLVILGAGYDSRALRFDGLKGGVGVYELDHPATQRVKLERMRQNLQVIPDHVVFVPVDLDADDPGSILCHHGYDHSLNSLFIWEGMTYYLSAAAVEQTLVFISRNTARDTKLIFDYFPPNVIDGTSPLREARALRSALKQIGEEFSFGLDPAHADTFLSERGFDLVTQLTAADCNRFHFKGQKRGRAMSAMFFFALAKVNPRNRILGIKRRSP